MPVLNLHDKPAAAPYLDMLFSLAKTLVLKSEQITPGLQLML